MKYMRFLFTWMLGFLHLVGTNTNTALEDESVHVNLKHFHLLKV